MAFAPEPWRTACLAVIRHAILFARALAPELADDQLFDLMDAVHNLPAWLQNWETCDQEELRSALRRYDQKWPDGGSLLKKYDEAIAAD